MILRLELTANKHTTTTTITLLLHCLPINKLLSCWVKHRILTIEIAFKLVVAKI